MDRETKKYIWADLRAQANYIALAGGAFLCCGFGALAGTLWAGAAAATFGGASLAAAVAVTAIGIGWNLFGIDVATRAAKALNGAVSKGLIAFTLAAATLGTGLATYHIASGAEADRRAAHHLKNNNLHLPLNKEMRDAIASGAVTRDRLEVESKQYALEFARRSVMRQRQEQVAQYEDCLSNPEAYRKQGLPCEKPEGPRPW